MVVKSRNIAENITKLKVERFGKFDRGQYGHCYIFLSSGCPSCMSLRVGLKLYL